MTTWFAWPVTFALVAALAAARLLRRRAALLAVVAVAAVAVPVVPLLLAVPVRCSDDGHSFGLRILPLGIGLLAVVAWLALLHRLEVSAGADPVAADRSVRRAAAFVAPAMVLEFLASGITMEVSCTGRTNQPRIAHLSIAAAVFVIAAAWATLRPAPIE